MSETGLVGPGGAPLNLDGAKPILGDDKLRAKQAAEEIRVILEAYDAELFPVMMLSPKGVIGVSIDVLPKARLNAAQEGAVAAAGAGPVAVDGNVKEDAPADEKAQAEVIPLNGQADADKIISAEGTGICDAISEASPDKA